MGRNYFSPGVETLPLALKYHKKSQNEVKENENY